MLWLRERRGKERNQRLKIKIRKTWRQRMAARESSNSVGWFAKIFQVLCDAEQREIERQSCVASYSQNQRKSNEFRNNYKQWIMAFSFIWKCFLDFRLAKLTPNEFLDKLLEISSIVSCVHDEKTTTVDGPRWRRRKTASTLKCVSVHPFVCSRMPNWTTTQIQRKNYKCKENVTSEKRKSISPLNAFERKTFKYNSLQKLQQKDYPRFSSFKWFRWSLSIRKYSRKKISRRQSSHLFDNVWPALLLQNEHWK